MSFVPMLIAGGGTVLKTAGDIQQGQATAGADQYQAAIYRQRSDMELEAAKADTQDYIRKGSYKLGQDVAMQGASGVTPAGSPLMVDSDTIRQVAIGAARTLNAGQKRAVQYQNEAQLYDYAAENAKTASYLKAGTSLLAGAGKIGQAAGWF